MSLFQNATLGGCRLRQAGQPWGTLLLSGRTPLISFLWGFVGDVGGVGTELLGMFVGLFCGVGHSSELLSIDVGLGDLFSFGGLSKKLVISTILSSVSVSRSSNVRVFFFGYGELDLGSKSTLRATLASHDVASCSLSSLFSSSILKFCKEGGVSDSIGGMFSLSESMHSGSSKYFGLYSCSVGLGHCPESEVTLMSLFLGVNTPGSFRGNCFPSLDSFFHGRNFSVRFSVSSTSV